MVDEVKHAYLFWLASRERERERERERKSLIQDEQCLKPRLVDDWLGHYTNNQYITCVLGTGIIIINQFDDQIHGMRLQRQGHYAWL